MTLITADLCNTRPWKIRPEAQAHEKPNKAPASWISPEQIYPSFWRTWRLLLTRKTVLGVYRSNHDIPWQGQFFDIFSPRSKAPQENLPRCETKKSFSSPGKGCKAAVSGSQGDIPFVEFRILTSDVNIVCDARNYDSTIKTRRHWGKRDAEKPLLPSFIFEMRNFQWKPCVTPAKAE